MHAGHPFCAECICRWRQRSWRCPVCRVMDGRELAVPPAAAGVQQLQARRSGGIVHVSQRLRPMAEQLLAESGDNVLDVLLQLLEVRRESHSRLWSVPAAVCACMLPPKTQTLSKNESISVPAVLNAMCLQMVCDAGNRSRGSNA